VKSNYFISDLAIFRKIIPKDKKLFLGIKSGVGGNRTLVQTSYKNDFYTFSFYLIFESKPTKNDLFTS